MDSLRKLEWIGSSLKDLKSFPVEVQRDVGFALYFAQDGLKHPSAKPLKGFGSANVLEVVESFDGNAYRAVYTVRFPEQVYVLHCFHKKSTSGVSTPKHDIELIKSRLKIAEERYAEWKRTK